MEQEERERLAREIAERESEIVAIRSQVDEKSAETARLQMEVDEARVKQQEATNALVKATTETMHHSRMHNTVMTHEHVHSDESDDRVNGHYSNGSFGQFGSL